MRVRKINGNLCFSSLILPDSSGWFDNRLFYIYFRIKSFSRALSYGSYFKFLGSGIVKTIFKYLQYNNMGFLI